MDCLQPPRDSRMARLCRFCAGGILAPLSLAFVYLFCLSMLSTSDVSTGAGAGEVLRFTRDNVLLNLLGLALGLGLLLLFRRCCGRVRLKTLMLLLGLWTLAAGALFLASVKLSPTQDSYIVSFWSMQSARGDTSYYHAYFRRFPYQFGYALYQELFFRGVFLFVPDIPEGYAYLLLQGVNLLLLVATQYALIGSVGLLFASERAQKLTALLLLLSPHGILTSSYLYGNLPGLAFSSLAILAFLRFQKRERWRTGLLCAACLALAVILKLNYMIVFIALLIVWLLCLLRRFTVKSLLCLLLCAAAVLGAKDLPQRCYEQRIGERFGKGVPLWSWMALGLHEGDTCSGWYDPTYTADLFERTGEDREETAREARAAIARRLEEFRQAPEEGLAFFDRKLLSQWNEPSYESIWNNNVREHFSEPGRLYFLLCREGEGALKAAMNQYQQLIFFGFAAALLALWRRREILQCLLPLVVLGGLLYHLLFEAKSQYILAYFLLMLPMAAWGLDELFALLEKRRR